MCDVSDAERVGDGVGDRVGDRVGDTGGDTRLDVSDGDADDRLLPVTGAGHEDVDDYSDCCSNDDLCNGDHQYCDDRDDDDDDDDDGSECYSDVDLCDESNEDDDDDDDVNADNFAYVNEYDDNNNHQLATSGGDYDTDTSDDDLRDNTNCDDDLDDDDDDDDDDHEDEVTDEDTSEYDDDNDDDDDDDDDSDRFDVVDRIKQADKHTQPHPHSTSQHRTPYAVPGLFGGHSRRTGVGRSSSRTPPPPPAGGVARSSPGVRPVPGSRSTSLRLPVSGSRSTSGGRDSLPVHRTTSLPVARGSPTPKGRQVARGASRAPARSQSERQFLSVNPDGRPREQPTWYDPKYLRDVQCCTKYSELFCDLCACVASVLSKCHKGPHIKEFCIATTSVLFFSTLAVYMALLARAPEKLPHRCYCLLLHLIFCTVACFCTTAVSAVCGVYACDSARLAALAFSVFATVVYFTDFVHSYREYRENKPEGGATRRWPTANGRRKPSATWGALFGEALGRARASKSPAWHDITPEQAPP